MMWKLIVPVVFAALCTVGSAGLMGGPIEVTLEEDAGARDALNFAVVEHNRQTNDVFLTKPSQVLSVTKKLVAGYLYNITVTMGKTPCRKTDASDSCTVHASQEKAMPYQCVFVVWTRPWLNETTMKEQKCS